MEDYPYRKPVLFILAALILLLMGTYLGSIDQPRLSAVDKDIVRKIVSGEVHLHTVDKGYKKCYTLTKFSWSNNDTQFHTSTIANECVTKFTP